MRAARELAGGDSGRIIVQRDGSVLVANRPRVKMRAGAGPGRRGPLPRPGGGLCRRARWGQWGRAARDAGATWNANPAVSLALGS